MKKPVRIKFQNGINYSIAIKEILWELHDEYDFIESEKPDFILFGPYGNEIPQEGNYIRIGYFCENIYPDLSICEWAFGIPEETEVKDSKYKKIMWHNLKPDELVKKDDDYGAILESKTKFCNFLYSTPVPYREAFYKQLSKYKKIDAPGRSMNNMPSVDNTYSGSRWTAKYRFLSDYKFTIAFENYVYPGYQTEKLYDAMKVNSLPIYCGDPNIGRIFNTKSFLNVQDYISLSSSEIINWLEKRTQWDFQDIRPMFFRSPTQRIKRKLKSIGRDVKMTLQFNRLDFSDVIDRIIALDRDRDLYLQYLKEPWLNAISDPEVSSNKRRWQQIFDSVL